MMDLILHNRYENGTVIDLMVETDGDDVMLTMREEGARIQFTVRGKWKEHLQKFFEESAPSPGTSGDEE